MELKERIKKYLADVLCVEYTGQLDYTRNLEAEEFTLSWQLNPDDNRPLILQGQFPNEDAFYEYIVREIKTKRFHLYKNFRAYKLPDGELL
jgi:hypothetical protein